MVEPAPLPPSTTPTIEPPTTDETTVVEANTSDPYAGIPEVLKRLIIKNETKENEPSEDASVTEITNENTTEPQEKSRKWMSVPEKEAEKKVSPTSELAKDLEPTIKLPDITGDILEAMNSTVIPEEEDNPDEYTINKTDFELPKNISDMIAAAEEGEEMVQETIISKKTTVYVTISDALEDREPVFVNLTGIRDFTGVERRIVSGCLDLSDLELNGESL